MVKHPPLFKREPPRLRSRLLRNVPRISALLIIGILAILGFDLWQSHTRIIADGERTTRNLAQVLEEQTARTVQAIDLSLLSINDAISLVNVDDPEHTDNINQLLRQKLAALPYARAIFVIGTDGFIIYDTDRDTPHVTLADRSYFTFHRDNPRREILISPPLISRSVNKWFISMSRRFNKPDGSFGGVIVVAVEPTYFQRLYGSINVGRDGTITIFHRDGTLMVRSPPADAFMGRSFADNILFQDLLPAANQGTFRTNSLIDGTRRIVSYRTVPDLPLVVIIGLSEQELLANWYSSVQISMVIGLTITLALVVLTYLLTQQLRRREELITAMQISEERYRRIVETAQAGIWILDAAGRTTFVNHRMAELLDTTVADLQGRLFLDFLSDDMRDDAASYFQHLRRGLSEQRDFRFLGSERKDVWALVSAKPLMDAETQIVDMIELLVIDITARRELEAELQHAQKMESIGQLAGGIAHDFNNLLTVIFNNAELAILDLSANDPAAYELREIRQAADRAAALTRQLLAFARKQTITPQLLNCNTLILNIDKLLRRLIGEHIELVIQPTSDLGLIRADTSQIEQLLVNLALNARDAMPNGGKLTIVTKNAQIETGTDTQPHATPRRFVQIVVCDTGVGMSPAVQAHIFEPFFTTKAPGKGTGLGLATCYGIVTQHGGTIAVTSSNGTGTTLEILLPTVEGVADGIDVIEHAEELPVGRETILLVEDEVSVREATARVLRGLGYTVLEASNGEEALWITERHDENPIDLLLTDMVMPLMGGAATAAQIRHLCPTVKVLFMSGYSGNTKTEQGTLEHPIDLLHKPFSPAMLARKVHETLNQGSEGQ
jgi:PAS domain S-box-containing protein